MRWEMETEEVEAVLETIWDLHDKISDAIHAISRSHFLNSIKTVSLPPPPPPIAAGGGAANNIINKASLLRSQFDSMGGGGGGGDNGGQKGGFVFVKDFRADVDDNAAMAEARSLNAIRTALENLEDQLEFFHTIQSQQRAERDAALARLEQSRIILAMRLADHQGKKYKVIEEALAFVGNVHDASRFVTPENLYEMMPRSQPGENSEDQKGKRSSVLMRMLISTFALAKNSLKMDKIGGVLGNAALFAVSMLAFLQLHQVAFRAPQIEDPNFYARRVERSSSEPDIPSQARHFDVLSARG